MEEVLGIGLDQQPFDQWVEVEGQCTMYKNKNISEKMSEYVGFSPPPTYFLHTLLGLACLVGLQ